MSVGNQFVNLLVGMKGRTSKTTMNIQNLRQIVCQRPTDFVSGAVVYTPDSKYIRNWQLGSVADNLCEANPWSGKDAAGRDWAGAVPTSTWLALYLVTDGTNGHTYCVWSKDFQAPDLSAGNLPNNPTHFCYLGANRTHESASEFKYSIMKVMRRSYYVGGGETSMNGGLPLIAQGLASKWTDISTSAVLPPTSGPLGVVLRASVWGGGVNNFLVALAPNRWFSDPSLYLNINVGTVVGGANNLSDAAIQGEILSDQGDPLAYWSLTSTGKVYANYFDDAQ